MNSYGTAKATIRKRTRRATATAGAALLLASAGIFASATPAFASAADHGRNPSTSYGGAPACNANSKQIGSRPVQNDFGQTVATVQIFYSLSCQTNWIRVDGNNAGGLTRKEIRATGGSWLPPEDDYGTASSYSMQVYAPGSTCVDFQVHLYYVNGQSYGETYSPAATYQTVC